MRKSWKFAGLCSGTLFLFSAAMPALAAPPTAAAILSFKPKQEGVSFSTPSPEEEASCKVELTKGIKKAQAGLLKIAKAISFVSSSTPTKIIALMFGLITKMASKFIAKLTPTSMAKPIFIAGLMQAVPK